MQSRFVSRRASRLGAVAIAALGAAGLVLSGAAPAAVAAPSGSVTGTGATGATLTVSPAQNLNASGDSTLKLTGKGYATKAPDGSNFGGAYLLFGTIKPKTVSPDSWGPSQGGAAGVNYDYAAGAGEYQWMVSYPGNSSQDGVPEMDSKGNWSATLKIPGARFKSEAGNSINCLKVQCGVITIGAHGKANKGVEVFTPVSFAGSQVVPAAVPVVVAPSTVTVDAQPSKDFPTHFVGQEAAVSAKVDPAESTGLVEFFDGQTSLGSAEVVDGTATLTTSAWPAGGVRSITATFTPSGGAPVPSRSAPEQYRVVDLARTVADIEVGEEATELGDAKLDWSIANMYNTSGYWFDKAAVSGNVTVPETVKGENLQNTQRKFTFSEGTGLQDGDGNTQLSFEAVARVMSGQANQWDFTNPSVHVNAAGDGYITAEFSGYFRLGDTNYDYGPTRVTIATFNGAERVIENGVTTLTVTPNWEGETDNGTWADARDAAFPNEFASLLYSGIRAFFYASGASSDVYKAPLPITLSYEASK